MYVVTARISGATVTERLGDLRRMALAAASPADGLEHVYVMPVQDGAAVVLFVLAASWSGAEATAERLCGRLIDASLPGAVLEHCHAAPVAPPGDSFRPEQDGPPQAW